MDQHEYVRLVEAYREDGKNKQRVICNLGRKDCWWSISMPSIGCSEAKRAKFRRLGRFGIGRVVFVGDRGMMLGGNVELLRSQGHG